MFNLIQTTLRNFMPFQSRGNAFYKGDYAEDPNLKDIATRIEQSECLSFEELHYLSKLCNEAYQVHSTDLLTPAYLIDNIKAFAALRAEFNIVRYDTEIRNIARSLLNDTHFKTEPFDTLMASICSRLQTTPTNRVLF